MPVQTGAKRQTGGSGGGVERVPMLEREVGKLRRELETLKAQGGGGAAPAPITAWMTTALAALGTLLGLMALLRH